MPAIPNCHTSKQGGPSRGDAPTRHVRARRAAVCEPLERRALLSTTLAFTTEFGPGEPGYGPAAAEYSGYDPDAAINEPWNHDRSFDDEPIAVTLNSLPKHTMLRVNVDWYDYSSSYPMPPDHSVKIEIGDFAYEYGEMGGWRIGTATTAVTRGSRTPATG